jgi:uncharacterized protein (DUF1015 family)
MSAPALQLEPFRALRYAPEKLTDLGQVLSPPYDVINTAQRAQLAAQDPHNVVRLILPDDYPSAARMLADWRSADVLVVDDRPALYVYEQRLPGHVQRGLVGALRLVPPDAGVVLPHENTMAGPVADRLALTEATAANLEPIFLIYDGGGAVDALTGEPVASCRTPDGVEHTVWGLTDPSQWRTVETVLAGRRAVIADGHHRYATYLRYQADRHAAGDGAGPWDAGLALLVDSSSFGPQVHAIHRVVAGLPFERALELAATGFATEPVDEGDPLRLLARAGRDGPAFLLADGRGSFALLTRPDPAQLAAALPADRAPAWRRLDVTVAHLYLIRTRWQLPDDETVVGFQHDVDEALTAAADSGGTALLLNPTPVAEVMAVAAAGERMPRKSTLFTPKPATGLLMRAFADQ